jgi:hypothetical protein
MTQDYVFGESTLKKIKIGDIICWSELANSENVIASPEMRKRFGFVSKLEIVFRGNRKVGIVKVIPMGSMFEKEVLAVCVSLVSQQQFHDI